MYRGDLLDMNSVFNVDGSLPEKSYALLTIHSLSMVTSYSGHFLGWIYTHWSHRLQKQFCCLCW